MQPSNNTLNVSVAESVHDMTQEFLKQNQIIDQELNKYDKLLDSCPMVIYRIWIFIYVAALSTGAIIMLYDIISVLRGGSDWSSFDALFMGLAICFIIISIYGSIQMRIGLYKRNLTRVDKCLAIFEQTAGYSVYFCLTGLVTFLKKHLLEWKFVGIFVGVAAIALINLYPARYARGVLAKRKVFQTVSSNPNNAI